MRLREAFEQFWEGLTRTNASKAFVLAGAATGFIGVFLSSVVFLKGSWLPGAIKEVQNPGATVRVFYGTDRKQTPLGFGGERGVPQLGTVDVSIPLSHRMGEIERPSWYMERFVTLDPSKYMVLVRQSRLGPDEFFKQVQAAATVPGKPATAFVFVHGYRVTFEDAALRTAQMAVDLGLPSVPVFYSWPSQGKTAEYTVDDGNADWAEPHLAEFLEAFADKSAAKSVYVVAHSMGSRITSKALVGLFERRKDLASRFTEVVLAAPDIDATVFKRDIAPRLTGPRHVTMYASSNDKALLVSRALRGGYSRAGEAGDGLVVLPMLETVDATGIDTDFLGHSYYGDTRPLLTDIALVLGKGMPAAERPTLRERTTGAAPYWEFKH